MPWARLDDNFTDHPKVSGLSLAAIGLWTLALSHAARYQTDGFIDARVMDGLARRGGRRRRHLIDELVGARLVDQDEGGYWFHDFLQYNPSREQIARTRQIDSRKKALRRNRGLRDAIRYRDQDRCRYCGVAVDWSDRRSSCGGTYDHIDPEGDNSPDNIVVACRGCNIRKQDRTPEAAGMPLVAVQERLDVGPSPDLVRTKSGSSPVLDTRPDPTQNNSPPNPPAGGAEDQATVELRRLLQ